MSIVEIIFIVLAGLTLVPVLVVAVETAAAVFLRGGDAKTQASGAAERGGVAVLVPAHDEAASIGATVVHLREQLRAGDRLLVVADNCADDTAALAREAGAEVVERIDAHARGKGYALAAGVEALRAAPPEMVIVVDADCRLGDGALDALAAQVSRSGRPAQAAYVMRLPGAGGVKPSPRDAVSALAFLFKNVVRPSGLAALGQPCLLTGTGMAFPWRVIESAQLATGDIVEDMRIGIELAIAGHPPMFCRRARVWSVLPEQEAAATTQRTRWEHGHLKSLLRFVPRLLWHGVTRLRFQLIALAAELGVPPLSLLVGWMAMLLAGAALLAMLGYSLVPLLLAGVAWGLLAFAVVLGWWGFARREIPFGALLAAPMYMLWKLPMYVRFLVKPQRTWVRTARDAKTQASGANGSGQA